MQHTIPAEVLAKSYSLDVKSLEKKHKIMEAITGKGSYCLKEYEYGWERLQHLQAVVKHLNKNGFTATPAMVSTISGEPGVIYEGNIFFLTEWVNGHDCNYHVEEELTAAASCLARFHLAGAGFDSPVPGGSKTIWDHLPGRFNKGRLNLAALIKKASRKKGKHHDFDKTFLAYGEGYLQQWEKALAIFNSADFNALLTKARDNYTLCHGDPAAHNFMYLGDNTAVIIDLDHVKGNLWAEDVAKFIYKPFKGMDWDFEISRRAFIAYEGERPLSPDEKKVVLAFLMCPFEFLDLAEDYYEKNLFKKEQKELTEDLKRWVVRETERTEYLRLLEQYLGEG